MGLENSMLLDNQGSIVLLIPETNNEADWLASNVNAEDYMWMGKGLAVENRYVENILEGLISEGFTISEA